MKLADLFEQDIVPDKKTKSKVLKKLPKMKRVEPPFTKGSFKKLLSVTGGPRIKDAAGGKFIKHI